MIALVTRVDPNASRPWAVGRRGCQVFSDAFGDILVRYLARSRWRWWRWSQVTGAPTLNTTWKSLLEQRPLTVRKRDFGCRAGNHVCFCSGSGAKPRFIAGQFARTCVVRVAVTHAARVFHSVPATCPTCHAAAQASKDPSQRVQRGRQTSDKQNSLQVKIPAGIR